MENLCKIGFDILPFDAVSERKNGYQPDKFRLLGKGKYVKLRGIDYSNDEEVYFFKKIKIR